MSHSAFNALKGPHTKYAYRILRRSPLLNDTQAIPHHSVRSLQSTSREHIGLSDIPLQKNRTYYDQCRAKSTTIALRCPRTRHKVNILLLRHDSGRGKDLQPGSNVSTWMLQAFIWRSGELSPYDAVVHGYNSRACQELDPELSWRSAYHPADI